MEIWEMLHYLFMTFVFSFLVGFERQNIGKDAGISAHVLVSVSACAIAILQRMLFMESGANGENQRLIAQVLTGMGFIGAGVIMKSGTHIRGLTTAATLWFCSIIGLIIGSEYWILGICLGGFAVVFLYTRDIYRGVNPFKRHPEFEDHHLDDK